jgi:hypothetical protein
MQDTVETKSSWGDTMDKYDESKYAEYDPYLFDDPAVMDEVDKHIRDCLYNSTDFTDILILDRGINIGDIHKYGMSHGIKANIAYYLNWCQDQLNKSDSKYRITVIHNHRNGIDIYYVAVKDAKYLSAESQVRYKKLSNRKILSWKTYPFVYYDAGELTYNGVKNSNNLHSGNREHIYLRIYPDIQKNKAKFMMGYQFKLNTYLMRKDGIVVYVENPYKIYTDGLNDAGHIPNLLSYQKDYEDPEIIKTIEEYRSGKHIPTALRAKGILEMKRSIELDKQLFGDEFEREIIWSEKDIEDFNARTFRPRSYVN